MTQTLYFTCLVTCVSIQLFQIKFFLSNVFTLCITFISTVTSFTLLSSKLSHFVPFLRVHWRTFYRAWYSLIPNPTSALICLCPILLLLDGSCSEIPKGDKSSLSELEWHQYDRADVCFGITDIKAETMLVSDNCSQHLLLPACLSLPVSWAVWGSLIAPPSSSKPVWSMGWWRPTTLPISFLKAHYCSLRAIYNQS